VIRKPYIRVVSSRILWGERGESERKSERSKSRIDRLNVLVHLTNGSGFFGGNSNCAII